MPFSVGRDKKGQTSSGVPIMTPLVRHILKSHIQTQGD